MRFLSFYWHHCLLLPGATPRWVERRTRQRRMNNPTTTKSMILLARTPMTSTRTTIMRGTRTGWTITIRRTMIPGSTGLVPFTDMVTDTRRTMLCGGTIRPTTTVGTDTTTHRPMAGLTEVATTAPAMVQRHMRSAHEEHSETSVPRVPHAGWKAALCRPAGEVEAR